MKKNMISIILPSYNVRTYIEKCLNSVLEQTYGNIEVLCIDAKSDDGTLEILRKYERKDIRVKVISTEKRSYGAQVNIGIKESKGDYICIVETDDWIEPSMVEMLAKEMEKSKADYVKGRGEMIYEITPEVTYSKTIAVFSNDDHAEKGGCIEVDPSNYPDICCLDYYLWTGLYRKELLSGIRLNETKGAAYQDVGFLFQIFTKSTKAVYLNDVVYHYRKSNENASTYNTNGFSFLLNEYVYVDGKLRKEENKWKRAIEKKLITQVFSRIRMMAYQGKYKYEVEDSLQIIVDRIKRAIVDGTTSVKDYNQYDWYNIGLFIENPRRLYLRFAGENWIYQERIIKLFDLCRGARTIIFGSGKFGKFVSSLLLKNKIPSEILFCDNDPAKWGITINNINVVSVREAVECSDRAIYILSPRYSKDMKSQLYDLGIDDLQIVELDVPINYDLFLFTDVNWSHEEVDDEGPVCT